MVIGDIDDGLSLDISGQKEDPARQETEKPHRHPLQGLLPLSGIRAEQTKGRDCSLRSRPKAGQGR